MQRSILISLALLGVAVAGVATMTGCGQAPAHEPAAKDKVLEPIFVTVAKVQTREVPRKIEAVGTLWAVETVNLTAKVPGRVVNVLVDEGDRVAPGDLLLEQAKTDHQLAVDEAKRSLEKELARLGLKELPEGVYDAEKLPGVAKGRTLVENSRRNLDRMRTLLERKAVTQQEYELTETSYRVEEATLRQTLLDVESWLASARHAASVLATAEKQLSDTNVVAPPFMFPKTLPPNATFVVSRRDTTGGEIAVPGTALFQLAADDVLKLRATVPERYLGQIKLTQKVELRVEAYPGEVFEATVSRISPVVNDVNRSFEIETLVPNTDHRLKQGLFAKASVLTRIDENAITAPLQAVYTFAGVTKVFVVEENKVRGISVEIGARGEGWVELIGQVPAGATVVTSGQSQLAEGTPITIRDDNPAAAPAAEKTNPPADATPAATSPASPMEHKE